MAGLVLVTWALSTWLSWHWPQRKRTKAARQFLVRHELAEERLQPAAERLLVGRAHGQYVAVSIAAVAMIAFLVTPLFDLVDGLDELGIFVCLGPVLWSEAIGGAIGIGRAARAEPHALRVAHLPRPTVADHLQPALRWWGPAMLAVAAVLVVLGVVMPPEVRLLSSTAAVAALGLAAASLLAAEGLVRWMLRVPQAPSDPGELRLLDTLQGEAIGDVALGVIPTLLAASLLLERFPIGAGSQLVVAVPIAALFVLGRDRRRHMRRRLWPTPPLAGDIAP